MNKTITFLSALLLFSSLLLFNSCGSEEVPVEEPKESLIEFKDGVYIEYYPGRKAIKFKGAKDENNQRDGVWYFYAENGVEQSMTEYKHGKREGSSFTRYPNGRMRYFGYYKNDQQTGVWILYKEDGTVESETDFGTVE